MIKDRLARNVAIVIAIALLVLALPFHLLKGNSSQARMDVMFSLSWMGLAWVCHRLSKMPS